MAASADALPDRRQPVLPAFNRAVRRKPVLDEDERASGLEHAPDLAERRLGLRYAAQGPGHQDGVDRGAVERYGLGLVDLFSGLDNVLARVVEEYLGAETARTFAKSEETVNRELDDLKEKLQAIDPTLADALETVEIVVIHEGD